MEGSENLRQRSKPQKSKLELISSSLQNLDEIPTSVGGDKPDTMAAGSSRIIRYVLFAFFVSCNWRNERLSA